MTRWSERPDLELALHDVPSGEPVILLAHEPDFADETARQPIDLQLSGHSHGGQIWLPVVGAPWLPPLGRLYPRGIAKNWGLNAVHEYWFGNDSIAGAAELSSGDYDVEVEKRVEPQCLQHLFPLVEKPRRMGHPQLWWCSGNRKPISYSGMTSIALMDG